MMGNMDNEIKRIFLKFFILKIIGDKPTHGYEIIQAIERKSNGKWIPSSGSIYPALELLESRGWIRSEEVDRRKIYTITPEGRVALDKMIRQWHDRMKEIALIFDAFMEGEPLEAAGSDPVKTGKSEDTI